MVMKSTVHFPEQDLKRINIFKFYKRHSSATDQELKVFSTKIKCHSAATNRDRHISYNKIVYQRYCSPASALLYAAQTLEINSALGNEANLALRESNPTKHSPLGVGFLTELWATTSLPLRYGRPAGEANDYSGERDYGPGAHNKAQGKHRLCLNGRVHCDGDC